MKKSYNVLIKFERIHHCSYCGCSFHYPIQKYIGVILTSNETEENIFEKVQKEADQLIDPVPCPECGNYQPEMMISRYRRVARPDFLTIVPMIVMGLLLIILMFFPSLWRKICFEAFTLRDLDKIYFPVVSGIIWLVMILQLCRWHVFFCHFSQCKNTKSKNLKENIRKAKWRKVKILQPKGTFPQEEIPILWKGFNKPFYFLLASLLLLTLVDMTATGVYLTNVVILLRHSQAQMMDRWELLVNGWYYLPKFVTLALMSVSLFTGSLDFLFSALLKKEIRGVKQWNKNVENKDIKISDIQKNIVS